jgi:5-hydroxyisourate hydrolase
MFSLVHRCPENGRLASPERAGGTDTLFACRKSQCERHDMGLSTHVLDTAHGCPAAGMRVTLQRLEDGGPRTLKTVTLNSDGRAPGPLLDGASFAAGRDRLLFEVADYFRGKGVDLPQPPFIDVVPLDFGIADPGSH